MSPSVIGVTILLPVVAAVLVLLLRKSPNARETATLIVGVVTFWHVWRILGVVLDGAQPRLDLFEVLPGVQLAFQVEGT